jgi:hypothetical protein
MMGSVNIVDGPSSAFGNLINFHEEPLGIIKLDASSREAGQDSGNKFQGFRKSVSRLIADKVLKRTSVFMIP